jgi:hypothetical protein
MSASYAAAPAVLGVDELLADQLGYVPEARRDAAEMRRAGGQVDVRRQLVLDDPVIIVRFSSAARAARARGSSGAYANFSVGR